MSNSHFSGKWEIHRHIQKDNSLLLYLDCGRMGKITKKKKKKKKEKRN